MTLYTTKIPIFLIPFLLENQMISNLFALSDKNCFAFTIRMELYLYMIIIYHNLNVKAHYKCVEKPLMFLY